jgi:hypothetical protein
MIMRVAGSLSPVQDDGNWIARIRQRARFGLGLTNALRTRPQYA